MNVEKFGKLDKLFRRIFQSMRISLMELYVKEMIEVAKIIQANIKIQEKAKYED